MLDVKFLAAGSTAEEAMSFICELTFNLINEKRGKYKIDIKDNENASVLADKLSNLAADKILDVIEAGIVSGWSNRKTR